MTFATAAFVPAPWSAGSLDSLLGPVAMLATLATLVTLAALVAGILIDRRDEAARRRTRRQRPAVTGPRSAAAVTSRPWAA